MSWIRKLLGRNEPDAKFVRNWFAEKASRGRPAPPSQIDLRTLTRASNDKWIESICTDPTGLYTTQHALSGLGAFYRRLFDTLKSKHGVDSRGFLDVVEVHLGAACPGCGSGLTGDAIANLATMQMTRSITIGGGGFEKLVQGECPNCPGTDYLLLWQGGDRRAG